MAGVWLAGCAGDSDEQEAQSATEQAQDKAVSENGHQVQVLPSTSTPTKSAPKPTTNLPPLPELTITEKQHAAYEAAKRPVCDGDIGTGTKEFPIPKNQDCYYYRVLNASVPRASYEFEFEGDFESTKMCKDLKALLPTIDEDIFGIVESHPRVSPRANYDGRFQTVLKEDVLTTYIDHMDLDWVRWTDIPKHSDQYLETYFDLNLGEHYKMFGQTEYSGPIIYWSNSQCLRCKGQYTRSEFLAKMSTDPKYQRFVSYRNHKIRGVNNYVLISTTRPPSREIENSIAEGRGFFGWMTSESKTISWVRTSTTSEVSIEVPIFEEIDKSVIISSFNPRLKHGGVAYDTNSLLFLSLPHKNRGVRSLHRIAVIKLDLTELPDNDDDVLELIKNTTLALGGRQPIEKPVGPKYECIVDIKLRPETPFSFKEKTP